MLSEELGRALATTVFSTSVYLATPLLLAAGSEAQKREYLPRLATGEISATLAVSEGPANATPRNVAVAAKDGKLNGQYTVWSYNGQKLREGSYKAGELISGLPLKLEI